MGKDLFIKYLQGKCSEEEFDQLLLWIREQSQSSTARNLIQEVWDEYEPEANPVEKQKYDRVLDRIHHQINISATQTTAIGEKKQRDNHRILDIFTRVAAILFLPTLLFLAYTYAPWNMQYASNTNDLEVVAPPSSKMHIALGDGTSVWLNNGSRLKYPYRFTGDTRKVKLSGEAYFEVAHNKKVPFLVETDYLTVKATGTTFNVNAYPDDHIVETTLIEGKVILLNSKNGQELKAMSPNESVYFDTKTSTYQAETTNYGKNIAWKDGLLVFKRDPIELVARKLERWYNVDVEITSEEVKGLTYTGTFIDESLPQLLELMAIATPVSYSLAPRVKLPDGTISKQKILIGLKANK